MWKRCISCINIILECSWISCNTNRKCFCTTNSSNRHYPVITKSLCCTGILSTNNINQLNFSSNIKSMRKFCINCCCITNPTSISNKSIIPQVVYISKTSCSKICLNFSSCNTNSSIRLLNNITFTRWSSNCNCRSSRNNIS